MRIIIISLSDRNLAEIASYLRCNSLFGLQLAREALARSGKNASMGRGGNRPSNAL
jgi:hypothetical protein